VPLHNKESQHQTGHHTMFYVILIYSFYLNWIVRQMPLHNKELRQQTGHHTYSLSLLLFIYICFNCAWGAAPQHGVATLERAHNIFVIIFEFIWIYLNLFASGACPHQGDAALDGAPDFFNVIIII
jgi:hypothetical protein